MIAYVYIYYIYYTHKRISTTVPGPKLTDPGADKPGPPATSCPSCGTSSGRCVMVTAVTAKKAGILAVYLSDRWIIDNRQ